MTATAHPTATTSSLRRRALGVAVTVLTCVVLWTVGAVAGVDYTVVNPGQPAFVVGVVPVIVFSLGSALVGWAGLVLLERFAGRRATVVWIALAVLIALLSLVPVVATEATTGAKVMLGTMHLAVAAVLIAFLPRRAR
ncbi:hypothetical protein GA0074696_3635 [Micromonospora purpureochromogenes]|uniref:Uncharacterized protein n=1 Tax=Micromonospora purpureochromogenes TaxID=47872 RepID=A0A1C4YRM2_9ACTN|nr:DUF6069 family protein [Micromonospora purpureochromogenes]SCF23432.1 hypothetical protein GA0074696_3635 [Micromonospora purpureochromogenes]